MTTERLQTLAWLNARIDALENMASMVESHRSAAVESERRDCQKALHALAAAHIATPEDGYGTNASWAVSDLCRAVKDLWQRIEQQQRDIEMLKEAISPGRIGGLDYYRDVATRMRSRETRIIPCSEALPENK